MASYRNAKKLEKLYDPWASKPSSGASYKSMADLGAAHSGDLD